MGDICRRHGVYVVSDEIHCDFAFPDHPHTVFLDANPELADRAIVCTAPSKTFNLAGLQVSNIWIPDPQIRARFRKEMDRSGYSLVNGLGLVACQAAYTAGGRGWSSAGAICGTIWTFCGPIWRSTSRRSGWWSRRAPTLPGWTVRGWTCAGGI